MDRSVQWLGKYVELSSHNRHLNFKQVIGLSRRHPETICCGLYINDAAHCFTFTENSSRIGNLLLRISKTEMCCFLLLSRIYRTYAKAAHYMWVYRNRQHIFSEINYAPKIAACFTSVEAILWDKQKRRMSSELLKVTTTLAQSHSDSLNRKKRQAADLLAKYAKRFGFGDPETVSQDSSKLILNVLHNYAGLNQEDLDSVSSLSSVNGIILGLRWTYYEHGHKTMWTLRQRPDGTAQAFGNPLEGNIYISKFRKIMKRKIAEIGQIAQSSAAYMAEYIIEHAIRFISPRTLMREMFYSMIFS